MAFIQLVNLSKSYGSLKVIHDFNLAIDPGERVVFVGPSGCGKSTLLRMISGIEDISGGQIFLKGEEITHQSASKRGFAMVFQNYALYPHMTVAGNIGFGLRMAKRPKEEIRKKVLDVAELLQIDGLLDRYPRELSGGQRQRVAIGRALVREPVAFLFDEPLSNLDAGLRTEMRLEIARLHTELNRTMIYVTHDQAEAMTLADRIVVLNQGTVEQVGTPKELYTAPVNEFVATFLGSPKINLFDLAIVNPDAGDVLPVQQASRIGVRSEDIWFSDENARFRGILTATEYFGSDSYGYFQVKGDTTVCCKLAPEKELTTGLEYGLAFEASKALLFDGAGRRIAA